MTYLKPGDKVRFKNQGVLGYLNRIEHPIATEYGDIFTVEYVNDRMIQCEGQDTWKAAMRFEIVPASEVEAMLTPAGERIRELEAALNAANKENEKLNQIIDRLFPPIKMFVD